MFDFPAAMSKAHRKQSRKRIGSQTGAPRDIAPNRKRWEYPYALMIVLAMGGAGIWKWRTQKTISAPFVSPAEVYHPRSKGSLTYNRDIAPILSGHCSTCHRPGQSAPFSLLSYDDAKRRAAEIVKVTQNRYMPPWLPVHGYGEFANERRLTEEEIGILAQWANEGTGEGLASDSPPMLRWNSDWQLGKPDLVVELPTYTLSSTGRDVYWNFVAPIPTDRIRFVRGVEFNPGNPKIVHHAFIQVDETSRSRQLAARNTPAGFPGMELSETAHMPGGQLLGWQPGKLASMVPDGLAWPLKVGTDLVLQTHMNPSGKQEVIRPSVGFYFTDQSPTNQSFRLKLTALKLDIPAGEANYHVTESYQLPVDVAVIRVGAHAHYLGRDLKGYATLPTGDRQPLLWIKNWDFKWQGDYQYANPVWLPKGTTVTLDFTYDNSTNNIRNPHQPPERVRFGLESRDEMGELYFQLLPRNSQDYRVLAIDFARYFVKTSRDFFAFRVEVNPADAEAHKRLGRILMSEGAITEAIAHIRESIRLDPKADEPHYDLGGFYLQQGKLADAQREFIEVVRLNPSDSEAFGSLGIISMQMGRNADAGVYFERALQINPEDQLARGYLNSLKAGLRRQ